MAQHTFAARASLLFLSEDSNAAWVEQESPIYRKDNIARIYVDRDSLWIEHPAYKHRIEVTRYARVIPTRSFAFRPVDSWPRRVALRMKSEKTSQRFIAFAKELGVVIKQSSTSKTEEQNRQRRPEEPRSSQSVDYHHLRHFSENHSRSGSYSSHNESLSSSRSTTQSRSSPYFTFPTSEPYRKQSSRQNSRDIYDSPDSGVPIRRSTSCPELIANGGGQSKPLLVVVPKPAGEFQRVYRKAGFNTIKVELPRGITFKNVVVLCKVSNLPKVLALLFVGDLSKSSQADVLIFDKKIQKGYRIDADENFGLEPMCPVRRLSKSHLVKFNDASADKIKTQVKLDVIDSLDHMAARRPCSSSFREVY